MKLIAAAVLIILLALGYFFLVERSAPTWPAPQAVPAPMVNSEPEPVNNRAGFAIFTNGTIRVFSDPKYHNRSTDVFITAESPNVILSKREDATWQQFFDSLPMKISNECLIAGTGERFCNSQTHLLRFYVNGVKVDNFLNLKIKHGDRALISYGDSDDQIPEQLKKVPTP